MQETSRSPSIGGVVLCRDGSLTLRRCLTSLSFVDRLLVVDSGSTDGSQDIAKDIGAEVIHHDWEGYAKQRNWASDAVGTDWVMFLDADEVLSDGGADEVRALILGSAQCISFPFVTYIRGVPLSHGRFRHERHVRAFRRGLRFAGDIHEALPFGPEGGERASHSIHHFTYRTVEHAVFKVNLYSSLLATGGASPGFARAVAAFVTNYALKGGWLDGRAGLDAHLIDLLSDVLTTMKAAEPD